MKWVGNSRKAFLLKICIFLIELQWQTDKGEMVPKQDLAKRLTAITHFDQRVREKKLTEITEGERGSTWNRFRVCVAIGLSAAPCFPEKKPREEPFLVERLMIQKNE